MLSAWDVRRLDSYARSMVDWHVVTDLIPTITPMVLDGHFDRNISFTQAAILVGVGLQRRTVDELQAELQLDSRQLLANFNKVIIRVVKTLQERTASEAGRSMPAVRIVSNSTVLQPLHVEMAAAAGALSNHPIALIKLLTYQLQVLSRKKWMPSKRHCWPMWVQAHMQLKEMMLPGRRHCNHLEPCPP